MPCSIVSWCDTVQKQWGQASWSSQVPRQYLPTQALVSPIKSFTIYCVVLWTLHNAVGLVMDLLLSRPANKGKNQPITNSKPRISPNTTVTSKKLKFASEYGFLLKFMWFTRNDLANINYAFCCWLQVSLTMPNLSFRGRRELSAPLQLHQKD